MMKSGLTMARAHKPWLLRWIVGRIEQCWTTSNSCGMVEAGAFLATYLEAPTGKAEQRDELQAIAEETPGEARDVEAEARAEKKGSW